MMEQQQLAAEPSPSASLSTPTTPQARRDYQRAQLLAQSLELGECQASFIALQPERPSHLGSLIFHLLTCLAVVVLIILTFSTIWSVLLMILLILLSVSFFARIYGRPHIHCEQAHLYSNGFVYIDPSGNSQAARWDQLSDFRRGGHEDDNPYGRLRWDIIRATCRDPRTQQSYAFKVAPSLPERLEICGMIERGYCDYWLPRYLERLAAEEVLDFDALLLHRDWLGKTTPGQRRFRAEFMSPPTLPADEDATPPGMFRGTIVQADANMSIEWLLRTDIKAIRVEDRHILIRTLEPVRRDLRGRADRLWFQLDTLGLKDAAILKAILLQESE
ncbi:MAG TPA: hypothetical protein VKR06_31740 [Ktedonosporobacter sp.]|nr:hypothetical protein [Ktedonosporobacter sp.]